MTGYVAWVWWLLFACKDPCPPGHACVVAGDGRAAYDGDGLLAVESALYLPSGVLRWPDGRLAIVDYNNYRIRAIDADGVLDTVAGSGEHDYATPGAGLLDSAFENPIAAVIGPDGLVYLAAQHEGRIHRLNDGVVEVVAGTGVLAFGGDGGDALAADLWDPVGLAFDGADLYVSDDFTHRVRRVRDGVIDTVVGLDDLDAPMGLAVAGRSLYIADSGHHRVLAYDLDGGGLTVVAGTGEGGYAGDGGPASAAALRSPRAVAAADGTLFIADSGNHVVRRVVDGAIDAFAGTAFPAPLGEHAPPDEAPLSLPSGLFVDDNGDLYVASMLAHQIVRVRAP